MLVIAPVASVVGQAGEIGRRRDGRHVVGQGGLADVDRLRCRLRKCRPRGSRPSRRLENMSTPLNCLGSSGW